MNLNGKITNPAEMRTVVTVQNPVIVMDAGNAQSTSYQDVATVYGKWVNAHGVETVTSDALKTVLRATVTVRYLASLTTRSVLIKNGERWQVISVDDIQERHEYMELLVERAKGTV